MRGYTLHIVTFGPASALTRDGLGPYLEIALLNMRVSYG
jgi:hypothetical protein